MAPVPARRGQRGHRNDGLAAESEQFPARGEDMQAGAPLQQRLDQLRDRVDDLFAIVENEEPGPLGHGFDERIPGWAPV
ncbi:hypothetical protein GTA07_01065 [Rhodococcus hoagii]|nr:hypothetical protein [Prescottella equi]